MKPRILHEYVKSTVFLEIWPEHSLIDMEQKRVGELFYFKYLKAEATESRQV